MYAHESVFNLPRMIGCLVSRFLGLKTPSFHSQTPSVLLQYISRTQPRQVAFSILLVCFMRHMSIPRSAPRRTRPPIQHTPLTFARRKLTRRKIIVLYFFQWRTKNDVAEFLLYLETGVATWNFCFTWMHIFQMSFVFGRVVCGSIFVVVQLKGHAFSFHLVNNHERALALPKFRGYPYPHHPRWVCLIVLRSFPLILSLRTVGTTACKEGV